jgi:NifU-like protein involved in Fe-S cluster formation
MSKGKVIGFRVSEDLYKNLLQQAEADGCTISDVARNIITEQVRNEDILRALQEMRKSLSKEIAQLRGGSVGIEDLVEVRRIVTLIAMAMPSVAKRI